MQGAVLVPRQARPPGSWHTDHATAHLEVSIEDAAVRSPLAVAHEDTPGTVQHRTGPWPG